MSHKISPVRRSPRFLGKISITNIIISSLIDLCLLIVSVEEVLNFQCFPTIYSSKCTECLVRRKMSCP